MAYFGLVTPLTLNMISVKLSVGNPELKVSKRTLEMYVQVRGIGVALFVLNPETAVQLGTVN